MMIRSKAAPRGALFALILLQSYSLGCPEPIQPTIKPVPTSGPGMEMGSDADADLDLGADADMEQVLDMAPDLPEEDMAPDLPGEMGADMPEDMACEPVSTVQFCQNNNFMCGELTALDACTGEMRTEVCGESCSLPQTCLLSVDEATMAPTGSACGCDIDNVPGVCEAVGKLCGPLAPPCEGMVCDNFCVDQVAAGGLFNCALGSGKLRCWGKNSSGQLGIGSTMTQKNPAPLDLELDVLEVAAGDEHACAILSDTSLICWGKNANGQLGISTTVNQNRPDLMDANSRAFARGVHKVVPGNAHTCALIDEDFDPATMSAPQAPFSAYCWGSNAQGAIGNPDRIILGADAGAPVLVKGLYNNVIDIAAGKGHNCAIVQPEMASADEREVRCWGLDDGGQLGHRAILSAALYDLDDMGRRNKMEVPDPNDPMRTIQVDVPTGFYQHYMYNTSDDNKLVVVTEPKPVLEDGAMASVSQESSVTSMVTFKGNFETITAGHSSSCVKRADGSVSCWGVLPYQHDTTTCKVPFHGEPQLSGLNVGECTAWPPVALWDEKTVIMLKKLGTNTIPYGLPSGAVDFRAVAPRPVTVIHHPSDPTVRPSYIDSNDPVTVTQMSAHKDHVCLLLDDAAHLPPNGSPTFTNVYCFGNNSNGQLGDSTNSPSGYPIKLTTDVDALIVRGSQINAGDEHSCVVADNDNIKCWGSNKDSQLGNENLMRDESFRPFDVLLR